MAEEINKNKKTKILLYVLFAAAFLWVLSQLFFDEYIDKWLAGKTGNEVQSLTDLTVIYPDGIDSLEPTLSDPMSRQRLVNIYEPLVKGDKDLNPVPALALSWGLLDDRTWEFSLRPNVVFHDGSKLDSLDVLESVERVQTHQSSGLNDLLNTIEKVEIIDDLTLRVITLNPDPLLLQKLSQVLIIPSEFADKAEADPVGTASYKFLSEDENGVMIFEAFDEYWGEPAKFTQVRLLPLSDKTQRMEAFLDGEGDFLSFVPFDAVEIVEQAGFSIAEIPTLEVQFLTFNASSELLDSSEEREAISLAIDQAPLIEILGAYVHPINQYVSNGVFGFNPEIDEHEYDLKKAAELIEQTDLKGKTLQFHLQRGLDVLGEHVRKSLLDAGIFVVISYMDSPELLKSIANDEADLYFFAFKSELGDSVDFLSNIAWSKGEFNVGHYKNETVDFLIESALTELDLQKRRDALQEAMRIVVEEDFIGVPLFESEKVYSFVDELDIDPRVDGLIYFDELIVK